MFRSIVRRAVLTLALFLGSELAISSAVAQKAPGQPAPEDPRIMSLEVAALGTLRHLDLAPAQLRELLGMAKGCASALKPTARSRTTPAFVKTLTSLRTALLTEDSDRIDELKEKLESIMEDDNIQLDDRVPISAAARRQAAPFVRTLKPSQVMAKLELLDEDEIEPFEMMSWALERGKTAGAAQWKAIRDDAAVDAAWLIAGSDETKSGPVARQIAFVLDLHHQGAGGKGPKVRLPDLEKQVNQWTARLDPFDILRHAMQREIAELLSNPRLPDMVQHVLDSRSGKK
jgi:hypothetical protein